MTYTVSTPVAVASAFAFAIVVVVGATTAPPAPIAEPVMLGTSGATTEGSIVRVLVMGAVRLVSGIMPPAAAVPVPFRLGIVALAMGYGAALALAAKLLVSVAFSVMGHPEVVASVGSATTMTCVRLAGQLATGAAHDVMVKVLVVLAVCVVSGTGHAAVVALPLPPVPVVIAAVLVACPAVTKHVVAAALNSVVLSVGLKSASWMSPMSAPMSTNRPALMLISALAGRMQLLPLAGGLLNCSPRMISGMLR